MADQAQSENYAIIGASPDREEPIVVIAVDDTRDDRLARAFSEENTVPSERFTGMWVPVVAGGQVTGAEFRLFDTVDDPLKPGWRWVVGSSPELITVVQSAPHFVAVLPAELAGDLIDLHDVIPRLGSGLFVAIDDDIQVFPETVLIVE